VKTTLNKRFYNLKRIKQKGLHTEIEFGFDQSRILTTEQIAQRKRERRADVDFVGTVSACGAPNDLEYNEPNPTEVAEPESAVPMMKI
jgi:anaerobic magnesium-protoporphyrin IX monomethyl ester cyclase